MKKVEKYVNSSQGCEMMQFRNNNYYVNKSYDLITFQTMDIFRNPIT